MRWWHESGGAAVTFGSDAHDPGIGPAAANQAASGVRAVIFDIGGVLEFTPPTGWEKEWASRLDCDPTDLVRSLAPLWRAGDVGELTLAQIEERTLRLLGLDARELHAFMEDLWAEYLGTLNQELLDYFAGLRPRYRTGLLSNSFVGAREREQRRYGFEDLCDVIVYSHEEGVKKPDARIYRDACERLGVRPEEAVFLDDVPACVDGAQEVGMRAVLFVDTAQAIADVQAHFDGRGSARGRCTPAPETSGPNKAGLRSTGRLRA